MKRPTSFEGFLEASSKFATTKGFTEGLAFQPLPSDVFVSPYSKCGTTWMQQIVHGLRTGGSMAFSEITEVVPWIEMAHDLGLDPNTPQPGNPRAYKSHLGWDEIPKGGKYIVVLRNPIDAFVSLYRFMEGWFFETGSVSLEEFAEYYLSRPDNESYWGHAASWWGQRTNPDVRLFTFEQMKADLAPVVADVAQFIGIDEDEDLLALATKQASFAFMKENQTHFDDHFLRERRDLACGLPASSGVTKVNTGIVGTKADLITPPLREAFDRKWNDTLGRSFGLACYEDMAKEL